MTKTTLGCVHFVFVDHCLNEYNEIQSSQLVVFKIILCNISAVLLLTPAS